MKVLKDMTNKIVVSSYDILYLDTGYGGGRINAWRDMYDKITLKFDDFKGEILGPQGNLWAELNTDQTTFNKLYIRGCVVAEKGWNYEANSG